jgi:hypothetical protein
MDRIEQMAGVNGGEMGWSSLLECIEDGRDEAFYWGE